MARLHNVSAPIQAGNGLDRGVLADSRYVDETMPATPKELAMQTLSRTARLIAAATAATMTLALFSTVTSLAGPQRSVLMAKTQQAEKLAAARVAPVALALATSNARK